MLTKPQGSMHSISKRIERVHCQDRSAPRSVSQHIVLTLNMPAYASESIDCQTYKHMICIGLLERHDAA